MCVLCLCVVAISAQFEESFDAQDFKIMFSTIVVLALFGDFLKGVISLSCSELRLHNSHYVHLTLQTTQILSTLSNSSTNLKRIAEQGRADNSSQPNIHFHVLYYCLVFTKKGIMI